MATFLIGFGLLALACSDASTARAGAPDVRAPDALSSLLAHAIPPAQLAGERARGIILNSATSNASVLGNVVGPHNVTGTISNNNSINNNVGITTVFQNTGNNSLLQSSTSIYISVR